MWLGGPGSGSCGRDRGFRPWQIRWRGHREVSMNRRIRKPVLGLLALLILFVAGASWATGAADYALDWHVMSGGGAPVASSGDVTLNGTLGQTAIGPSLSGDYDLGAGFWYGALERGAYCYLPLILKRF
jgi:hypothetical protein